MNVKVNGGKATLEDFVAVARSGDKVFLSPLAHKKILRSRRAVEGAVNAGKVIYGITTGFGAFKNTVISKEQTSKLQENLILSHAVGVGDYLPTEVVRGLMFLMINYLSKGYSGIKWETVAALAEMLNKRVHPLIPEKGSVGSSGDLAPSAHMALVLIGKGEAEYHGKHVSGSRAMRKARIKPVKLDSKEGLALINNTSTMTSIAALLIHDARSLLKVADVAASLSLQALRGTDLSYDRRIHALKPHEGEVETAKNLRRLLAGSAFIDRKRVQEAYSFRCVPQIYGAVREALTYAEKVVNTELNSVTDNPLIFSDGKMDVISGGNFHGEPVAIAMDTLGIALSEIANISDRRTASLLDPATSNGLPAFLVEKGGLNSGFMILQYTTAALVSENKILAHPASVDSIPTSANIEDLVSMGTIAARKAREIFENVSNVLAIEILTACQAIDMRRKVERTLKLSPQTQKIYRLVRKVVPYFPHDTVYYPYVQKIKSSLLALV
ncbi:MAG: Histidine ammonia-lyase [candidate division CPR1 bacterium GW2011_GWC1_49_13]|uniref:Histidine ammonia-lyase n=1 Tax=candidate division CPR1 bacterium GW2011_GWC1_49_13 TaxID=1618342 RepID=A0A0G1YIM2_9BACT|nr:MAG: Histidine ammonia-lyase [candidate division CPR1 bacterium GW2011_GWC1_49_13]